MGTPKKPKRQQKAPDLSRVTVQAESIRFDKYGNVIVDPKFQAEAESFKLPPWLGGGGGGGGIDAACPGVDAACEPESVCADAACEPESVCTDAACEPESVCTDAACEPESVCTDMACGDIACEPESVCADATCEPESKCVDLFCKEKNNYCGETNIGCSSGPSTMEDFGIS